MNQNMINDTIRIELPPEFRQMEPGEKKEIYASSAVVPEWSAHDPERHMIFSASWKRMNRILAMTACSADGAKGLEKRMRIALRDRNYRFCEYTRGKLGEKKTFGFTFTCRGTGAAFSPDARKPAEKAVPRVLLLILQRMESECQILSITASVSFFRSVRIWDVR